MEGYKERHDILLHSLRSYFYIFLSQESILKGDTFSLPEVWYVRHLCQALKIKVNYSSSLSSQILDVRIYKTIKLVFLSCIGKSNVSFHII